ncbi:imidazole glycerol phosphate synthase subunit HisH [Alkalibacter mobilis]|uniref:imidazole glycerol phosphate synthase subunit HisH n=1 Tax=Alkalibacter mobilis TaxID=2787712 RepID=UPI00189FA1D2|nr:imidazole glycerol phosphate synthase subunit HisH [Alkalibacter mobilis]MBF7096111.1 imidazole glycerol phosphate synthase subunit HisH [Alkalibacter mobilis]
MIAIIDYGVGNLMNVYNALKHLDMDAIITGAKDEIDNSDAIILPGVGAFNDAMLHLKETGLDKVIIENVKKGKPILGICLGMQLLFEKSHEDGEWEGLGLLKGEIVKFKEGLKVPHMGWNELHINKVHPLVKNINEGEYVYFVHSYHLDPKFFEDVLLYTDYGVRVPAVVCRDNIIGMQFHPEKSSTTGIKLLENFKELIK